MSDLWPEPRRSDSVMKVDNAKDCIQHLSKSYNYLRNSFPHVDLTSFKAQIEKAQSIENPYEAHEALTNAVVTHISRADWVKVRQRFYKHQSESRHRVKRISIYGDVHDALEKFAEDRELESLSEAVKVLLHKSDIKT